MIIMSSEDGRTVEAQGPVIVSASRSTDVPAFYSDWFVERFEKGYVKWFNPFNGVPLYVSFAKTRLVVFWTKNPRPMLEKISGRDETPHSSLRQGRTEPREGRNTGEQVREGGHAEGVVQLVKGWGFPPGHAGKRPTFPASSITVAWMTG